VHIVFFILFFIYFLFLGRGLIFLSNYFFKNISINDNSEFFDTPIYIYYPLIGIMFFGNISFILNFFIPLKNIFVVLTISLVLLGNFLKKLNLYNFKLINIIMFINLLILSISSYDINFQYDAGYYHLDYQNWLREEKIVFGLSNLNGAFGTSSIIDYISAPLWISGNLILLHYLSLLFIVVLLNFLIYHIFTRKNDYFFMTSLFLLVFAFLDNFGINGGRNGFFAIHGIVKPDVAQGVVFYLASIFLTYLFIENIFNKKDLIFLNLLIIFAYQLKISSALLFIFLLFVLFRSRIIPLKALVQTNLLLVFWLIKNVLLTGCLVYPVSLTCINTPWFDSNVVTGLKNVTADFNNSYLIGTSFILWFKDWILIDINKTVTYNFITSFLILFIFKLLFTTSNGKKSTKKYFVPILFIFANLFLWIIGAAHPRFVYGVCAYMITLLSINYRNVRFKKVLILESKIFLSLLFISIVLIPRLNSYKTFLEDPLKEIEISVPETKYIEIENGWIMPADGDQCWVNLKCIPYNKILYKSTYFGFNSYEVKS
jgi:hypothetical protein